MKKNILLSAAACEVFYCYSTFGMEVLKRKGFGDFLDKINTAKLENCSFLLKSSAVKTFEANKKAGDDVKRNYCPKIGNANRNAYVSINNSRKQFNKSLNKNLLPEFDKVAESKLRIPVKDIQCVSLQMQDSNKYKYRNVACFVRAGVIVGKRRQNGCSVASSHNSLSFFNYRFSDITNRETDSSSKNNRECFCAGKVKFPNLDKNNKKTTCAQNNNIGNSIVSNEIVKKNSTFQGKCLVYRRKKIQDKFVTAKFPDAGKKVPTSSLSAFSSRGGVNNVRENKKIGKNTK